jgi:CDP-diglyceride synthetase
LLLSQSLCASFSVSNQVYTSTNAQQLNRLSWADTTASTFGRMFGSRTPKLPSRTPVLGLPLAPRKSLAGFIAATVTGALIAFTFWGWVAPVRFAGSECTWGWDRGVQPASSVYSSSTTGGWTGLGAISAVAGLVSGVAEALGKYLYLFRHCLLTIVFRPWVAR